MWNQRQRQRLRGADSPETDKKCASILKQFGYDVFWLILRVSLERNTTHREKSTHQKMTPLPEADLQRPRRLRYVHISCTSSGHKDAQCLKRRSCPVETCPGVNQTVVKVVEGVKSKRGRRRRRQRETGLLGYLKWNDGCHRQEMLARSIR